MYYINTITNKTICLEYDEVQKYLNDNPDITFEDFNSNETLEDFLKRSDTNLKETFNIKTLEKKSKLNETQANFVLNSSEWNGECGIFPQSLMDSEEFCTRILDHDNWNGDLRYFSNKVMAVPSIMIKITKTKNWNGEFEHFLPHMIDNIDCCMAIVKCGWWNGDCSPFPHHVRANKEFCLAAIDHVRWNGNHQDFAKELFDDEDFAREVSEIKMIIDLEKLGFQVQ